MSPIRPFKIRDEDQIQAETAPENETVRLILSMNGDILYANAAFTAVSGMDARNRESFLSFVEFTDPDEALRSSSILSSNDEGLLSSLRSGLHTVYFARTDGTVSLQFDHVRTSSGDHCIIASGLPDDADFVRSVERYLGRLSSPGAADTLMDLSGDLLCALDAHGRFESLNAAFMETLGFTLDDLKGRVFLDLVHPDDRQSVQDALKNMLAYQTDSGVASCECRLISNAAGIVWTRWKHRRANGKLYAAGQNIGEVKRLEQDMLRHERQLSEAEAIGKMGHWHWTSGQQAILFSDEIYRMFGVTRGSFQPTLDSVNAMLHRRDAGRMIQAFQRAIIEQNDHEIDFRISTPDGDTRHVRCQGRCDIDDSGDVTGLYGIMQDVTDVMNHERDLREAKETAERAYASKSQFLANMSHELRTPLNAIIGFSEMMQQQLLGPIGNERYLDYIKGIRESGEHLLDLITDILDMSKIEAGKYSLDLSNFNLSKVIRLAVHMVEARASDRRIRIATKFADESVMVTADRRAVMQIMLNLLSNAVKFSHAGGVVDVECLTGATHVAIRIVDRGIGIPANKLKTITNPFEQAANQYTRSHEGTGLGLSITKELAELHGGAIHIESVIDSGTTVTVRLPIDASKSRRDVAAA